MRRGLTYANVAAALIILSLACLAAAQSAFAAVLYDQTAGASGVSIPSQESPDEPASTTQATDDILVPAGDHWEVTEVEAPGGSTSASPISFNVFLYEEGNFGPGQEIFAERDITGSGPDNSLLLHGAPLLNPGTYWLSVQAVGLAADPWSWETVSTQHGHWQAFWQNPGNALHTNCTTWWFREGCLKASSGQSDQAFKLIGTFEQVLKTGHGVSPGGMTSSPPGISCSSTCSAAFPRGTVVTLTGFPLNPEMEFTGWSENTASPAPGIPPPQPLNCPGTGTCQLTLNEDITVYGTYWPASRIRLGKLKRNLADGATELPVTLPAAGVLSMASGGVRKFRDPRAKAGTLRLPLVPRTWAARRLSRTGEVTAQLRIKFRPFGGRARIVNEAVTLHKRLHG